MTSDEFGTEDTEAMTPDDRMDEALRAIARAEASRDFTARVRTRLEARNGAPTAWPRVATALAVVLLVATFAWLMREAPPEPSEQAARATAPVVLSPPQQPVSQLEPRPTSTAWSRSARGSRRSNPVAPVTTGISSTSDHDRALAPLSALDALSLPSVAPDAMVVVDHVIAPLAPIAPLSAVPDEIGEDDRGER